MSEVEKVIRELAAHIESLECETDDTGCEFDAKTITLLRKAKRLLEKSLT